MEVLQKLRSIDKFGQKPIFKMKFEGGGAYVSYMGALCSAIFITISAIFFYSKIMVLIEVSSVTIIPNYAEAALTFDDKFSADDGMLVAVALTKYDGDTEVIEDLRYGELVIGHYGWGYDSVIGSGFTELETHACSDKELGLVDNSEEENDDSAERTTYAHAYPLFDSINEVRTWKKKFKCIEREDLIIWGDYNAEKAQQMSI